ncbi:MAG: hypothetical protein HPKKFMNG_01960 [Planctomycetes bacterium]|nr:hypothetical protein [Planctomycetota bacterium]
MANGENCPGCTDKAAPISGGGSRLMAFKPMGERGPTVYRDMTGIEPEHMARLSTLPPAPSHSYSDNHLTRPAVGNDPYAPISRTESPNFKQELPQSPTLLTLSAPQIHPNAHLLSPEWVPPEYKETRDKRSFWDWLLLLLQRLHPRWLGDSGGELGELGHWDEPSPQRLEDCHQSLRYRKQGFRTFQIPLWTKSVIVEHENADMQSSLESEARLALIQLESDSAQQAIDILIGRFGIPADVIEAVIALATLGFSCPRGCVLQRRLIAWNFRSPVISRPQAGVVKGEHINPVTGGREVQYVAVVRISVSFAYEIVFDVFCLPPAESI